MPVLRNWPFSRGKHAAREILLLCTTASISPARKEQISQLLAGTVDWEYMLNIAELHDVTPLIAYNILNNDLTGQVPKPYQEQLNKIHNGTLYRNVILSSELADVLSGFGKNGIAVISLKGTVLAEILYGNPGLRATADTDIMVQPQALPQAHSLLIEMGYKQLESSRPQEHPFHEVPYCKQSTFSMFIELHWDLDDERLVSVPKDEIWRRAQQLRLQWGSPTVLSPEDTLLFLANQLIEHFIPLKILGDITELLKKYEDTLDWDYILKSAHSWGTSTALYYSLKQAKNLLGAPVPADSLKVLEPGTWRSCLINFIINEKTLISPMKRGILRDKTFNVVRSLMMKHFRKTLSVLSMTHSRKNNYLKGTWFWIAVLIIVVFSAALWRNVTRMVSGWRETS